MGYKVIVVDDEMLIRKRIIYGFEWEELGYEIENEAGDGLQALALMEKKTYDLAIVTLPCRKSTESNWPAGSGRDSIRHTLFS